MRPPFSFSFSHSLSRSHSICPSFHDYHHHYLALLFLARRGRGAIGPRFSAAALVAHRSAERDEKKETSSGNSITGQSKFEAPPNVSLAYLPRVNFSPQPSSSSSSANPEASRGQPAGPRCEQVMPILWAGAFLALGSLAIRREDDLNALGACAGSVYQRAGY